MAQTANYPLMAAEAIEADLGRRFEAIRLGRNLSQARLAAEAGISRRTITRLEAGEGISLDTLIRVLKALGLADRLQAFLPDPTVRPIDRVRLKGQERKRARQSDDESGAGWHWAGDEPA